RPADAADPLVRDRPRLPDVAGGRVHDERSLAVHLDALGAVDTEGDLVRIDAGGDDEVVLQAAGTRVVGEVAGGGHAGGSERAGGGGGEGGGRGRRGVRPPGAGPLPAARARGFAPILSRRRTACPPWRSPSVRTASVDVRNAV